MIEREADILVEKSSDKREFRFRYPMNSQEIYAQLQKPEGLKAEVLTNDGSFLPVVLEYEAYSDGGLVSIKKYAGERLGDTNVKIDKEAESLIVYKNTANGYESQGLSQLAAGLLFEIIKIEPSLRKYAHSVQADVNLSNSGSFHSTMKIPNLTQGGYYPVELETRFGWNDISLAKLKSGADPRFLKVYVYSDATKNVPEPTYSSIYSQLAIEMRRILFAEGQK